MRIITAIIGIPAMLVCAWQGGLLFLLFVFLVVLAGSFEFHKLVAKCGCKNPLLLLVLGALIFPTAFFAYPRLLGALFFCYLLFCYLYYLYYFGSFTPVDLGLTILAVLYVSCGFSHLLLLRQLDQGFWLVFYVFAIVWATDTGAYFTGINWGKHKLAPGISPHKTWEGFAGGVLGSMAAALLLTGLADLELGRILVLIAPLISVAGQLGDLFESGLKRYACTKDSGNLIPGHGGVLDRFDSMLWAAPLAYYLIIMLLRYGTL
jgi:phosphatidate cytidylyltransferase